MLTTLVMIVLAGAPPCPRGVPAGTVDEPAVMSVELAPGRWLLACGRREPACDAGDCATPPPGAVPVSALVVVRDDGDSLARLYEDPILRTVLLRAEGKTLVATTDFVDVVVSDKRATRRCAAPKDEPPSARLANLLGQKRPVAPEPALDREAFVVDLLFAALRGHAGAAELLDRWDTGPPGEGEITEIIVEDQRVIAQLRQLGCRPYGVAIPPRAKATKAAAPKAK
jgi:hypothetical protein